MREVRHERRQGQRAFSWPLTWWIKERSSIAWLRFCRRQSQATEVFFQSWVSDWPGLKNDPILSGDGVSEVKCQLSIDHRQVCTRIAQQHAFLATYRGPYSRNTGSYNRTATQTTQTHATQRSNFCETLSWLSVSHSEGFSPLLRRVQGQCIPFTVNCRISQYRNSAAANVEVVDYKAQGSANRSLNSDLYESAILSSSTAVTDDRSRCIGARST